MNILEAIQKEDGFVNEKIEIRNGPYGSSIFSKVEIQKDETIMEINQKSIISVDSIIKSGLETLKFVANKIIYRRSTKVHGSPENGSQSL